jgi:epoxyqueuosine reductase
VETLITKIKQRAGELGFPLCGIAPAMKLTEEAERLSSWIKDGLQGRLTYLTRNNDKRMDISGLVKDARSVIVLGMPYYHGRYYSDAAAPRISRYAIGKDYHVVIRENLMQLLGYIQESKPDAKGKVFVDTAPVFEKKWAQLAGLGAIGKNSLLITREYGSYLFLSEMVLNIELKYDQPFTDDLCGTCTSCIDACPTRAIIRDKVLDVNRCISYLNKDYDGEFSEDMAGKIAPWIFGCDVCQMVCPYNGSLKTLVTADFQPCRQFCDLTTDDWNKLSEEDYNRLTASTSLNAMPYSRLKRTLRIINCA